MNHIRRQLKASRPPRRRQPYDRWTKAELWERLKAAEDTLECVGDLANDLGRDLHGVRYVAKPAKLVQLSERAYRVRDVAQGHRRT